MSGVQYSSILWESCHSLASDKSDVQAQVSLDVQPTAIGCKTNRWGRGVNFRPFFARLYPSCTLNQEVIQR